jgi:hypothetical protein
MELGKAHDQASEEKPLPRGVGEDVGAVLVVDDEIVLSKRPSTANAADKAGGDGTAEAEAEGTQTETETETETDAEAEAEAEQYGKVAPLRSAVGHATSVGTLTAVAPRQAILAAARATLAPPVGSKQQELSDRRLVTDLVLHSGICSPVIAQ